MHTTHLILPTTTLFSLLLLLSACRASSSHTTQHDSARPTPPLADAEVMPFAVIRDADDARRFYCDTLGLEPLDGDPYALVLRSGPSIIRLQINPNHQPSRATTLGWRVKDIRATLRRLAAAGVAPERYDWMNVQDDSGVATFPNGDMVAWFKDNEGNLLSIAQLAHN